eukprot:ctg_609.g283
MRRRTSCWSWPTSRPSLGAPTGAASSICCTMSSTRSMSFSSTAWKRRQTPRGDARAAESAAATQGAPCGNAVAAELFHSQLPRLPQGAEKVRQEARHPPAEDLPGGRFTHALLYAERDPAHAHPRCGGENPGNRPVHGWRGGPAMPCSMHNSPLRSSVTTEWGGEGFQALQLSRAESERPGASNLGGADTAAITVAYSRGCVGAA